MHRSFPVLLAAAGVPPLLAPAAPAHADADRPLKECLCSASGLS